MRRCCCCCVHFKFLRVSFDREKKKGFLSLSSPIQPLRLCIIGKQLRRNGGGFAVVWVFWWWVLVGHERYAMMMMGCTATHIHGRSRTDRRQNTVRENGQNNNSLCRERVQWNVKLRSHARNRSLLYVPLCSSKNSVFYFILFSSGCCFFLVFFLRERERERLQENRVSQLLILFFQCAVQLNQSNSNIQR